MKDFKYHEPVMVREVIEALHFQKQARYIDATLGTGGHTLEIVKLGGNVLGIEIDPEILEVAKERLAEACPTPNKSWGSYKLIHGNFRKIDEFAKPYGFEKVSGILFDLGVSNLHFEAKDRGFSFSSHGAALDMRLDTQSQGVTGADLLNSLRQDQLDRLFEITLTPSQAHRLSQEIVEKRKIRPIKTAGDLLTLCRNLLYKESLHAATLPFLAIRIAVNNELDNLKEALPRALTLLEKSGRLVVISFHSGEDVIVKNLFRVFEKEKKGRILTKKPIRPTDAEISENPKSRSAKLRVFEKYEQKQE